MIVVRVELWPGGDHNKAENLGVVSIANRGCPELENLDHCTYDVQLDEPGARHRTTVKHYRRRGWRKLVAAALDSV